MNVNEPQQHRPDDPRGWAMTLSSSVDWGSVAAALPCAGLHIVSKFEQIDMENDIANRSRYIETSRQLLF